MIINGSLVTLSALQTWAMVGIIIAVARLWYITLSGKDKD